jgi:VWFA-related protein
MRWRLAVCLAGAALDALAQEPSPARPASSPLVVQVGVDLIQTDVVVTDRSGNHVTDLQAADFELIEQGQPRTVTHCRYVPLPPAPRPVRSGARLLPADVRRVFAFIIDDNGLRFESNDRTREALLQFIDEQMGPGDLVAIGRTGYNRSAQLLQQFTNDKAQLRAVVRDLRRNPATMGYAATALASLPHGSANAAEHRTFGPPSRRGDADADEPPRAGRMVGGTMPEPGPEYQATMPGLMKMTFQRDMLEGLGRILSSMSALPGRKAMVFLSDSLSLYDATIPFDPASPRVIDDASLDGVHGITDLASRLAVVIYCVAPGGRHLFDEHAAPHEAHGLRRGDGLSLLADATGGLYLRSGRDLSAALQRAAADQQGYYLIGYTPEANAFDRKGERRPFRRIEVRVKRTDLVVRSRAGYFAVTDAEAQAASASTGGQLTTAALSPVTATNLDVRLSSLFEEASLTSGHPAQHVVRSVASVAGATLGAENIEMDVLGLVMDAFGKPVGEVDRSQMRVVSADSARVVLAFDVAVEKPGAYQVRLAVRDTATGRLGSARDQIEVPDLGARRLALGGLRAGDGSLLVRARAGETIEYATVAFNARLDSKRKSSVVAKARLLRDGSEIATGDAVRIVSADAKPAPASGLDHLDLRGHLPLGAALEAGDYALELTVSDALDKKGVPVVCRREVEILR